MKQKVIKINPISAIAIDPEKPEEMNELYPFMHNLFVNPNIYEDKEHHLMIVMGLSDHVDEDDQNPVHYAGMLAKMVMPHADWRNIDHIYMINLVRNGVPDPEGAVEYLYKGKTITYPGRSGKYLYQKNVDVSMMYIDRFLKPSKDTDPGLCEMIDMFHREEEKLVQEHAYENLEKVEDDYRQDKLDFWKEIVQR